MTQANGSSFGRVLARGAVIFAVHSKQDIGRGCQRRGGWFEIVQRTKAEGRRSVRELCWLGGHHVLPLAVAAEYAHHRTGKPSTFMHDTFPACFASCNDKEAGFAVYPQKDPDFVTRGRVWAVATGEPNAGKSPTFECWSSKFRNFVRAHAAVFPWARDHDVLHVRTRGTHSGPHHARPSLSSPWVHQYERVDRHAETS